MRGCPAHVLGWIRADRIDGGREVLLGRCHRIIDDAVACFDRDRALVVAGNASEARQARAPAPVLRASSDAGRSRRYAMSARDAMSFF